MPIITRLALIVFTGFLTFSTMVNAQTLNSVVAIVNNSVITQTELNQALIGADKQLAASQNPEALDKQKIRALVLQQLIDEKLELDLAKRVNIVASDAQVKEAIQRIADSNHMTSEELREALAQRGISFTDYEKIIRKQILLHQLQQTMVANKVQVTSKDHALARKHFKMMQASMQRRYHLIDIVSNDKSTSEKILMSLKNGKSVHQVVPDAKDLGWRTDETLPTLFATQVKNMQAGDIAGPIQAPNGFHILKLLEVTGDKHNAPSKTIIDSLASQIAFERAVKEWLLELRKTAYIKIISE